MDLDPDPAPAPDWEPALFFSGSQYAKNVSEDAKNVSFLQIFRLITYTIHLHRSSKITSH